MHQKILWIICVLIGIKCPLSAQISPPDTTLPIKYAVNVSVTTSRYDYGINFFKRIKRGEGIKWFRGSFETKIGFDNEHSRLAFLQDRKINDFVISYQQHTLILGYEYLKNLGQGLSLTYGVDQGLIFYNDGYRGQNETNMNTIDIYERRESDVAFDTRPFFGLRYKFDKYFFIGIESNLSLLIRFETSQLSTNTFLSRNHLNGITVNTNPTNVMRFGIYF